MTNPLPTLNDILQFDVEQIGPKFYRLGQVAQLGLETPDFFCLPRTWYDQFYSRIAAQIEALIERLEFSDESQLRCAENEILQCFVEEVMSEAVQFKVLQAFDNRFERNQKVAVRATIIGNRMDQGEDGSAEPFAGMSESYLNVTRSELIQKIKHCWASGFSQQAMLYRKHQDYHPTGFGVAVAVQRMVDSAKSFVAFSCDPQTQAQATLIACGEGLGDLVVQEKTDIEHVRVDHRTGEINRTSGVALLKLLRDDQVQAVDSAVRTLGNCFRSPQDVEGSFDSEGNLYILQSRPISIDQTRYRLWSSANISESFPGVTTPLTFSVARRFYADLNRDYYRRCGVSGAKMRSVDHAFDRLLGYLDGRIYHCISNFQLTTSLHPLARFFESDYDRIVCELEEDYRRPIPQNKSSVIGTGCRIVWALLIAVGHYFTLPWKFWRFTAWWKKLKKEIAQPQQTQCANRLIDSLDRLWNEASRRWGITLINYQQMVYFHSKAEKHLNRWCKDPQTMLSELLSDGKRLFGSEVVASALEIADAIRIDEANSQKFVNAPAAAIWKEIDAGVFDERLTIMIKHHLQQYGMRGLEELKMEVPNLKSQPEEFIRILQSYVQGKQRYSDLVERERKTTRQGFWKFARSVYFNPFKLWTMSFVIKSLQKALQRRELGRYMRGELFGYTKEHLLAIAEELVSRNCIDQAEDVFYLAVDEIKDYVEGRSCSQDLKAIVRLRRVEANRFKEKNPRKELATYGLVHLGITQEPLDSQADNQIRGLGSCAGIVRGRARVIRQPSLSEEFCEDEILVAPETDPGWLYLMLRAKGIVVERGSMLSHTAITGRRFAIPTVVAAVNVCQVVSSGDEIQIDGQAGTVEILNKAGHDERRAE